MPPVAFVQDEPVSQLLLNAYVNATLYMGQRRIF